MKVQQAKRRREADLLSAHVAKNKIAYHLMRLETNRRKHIWTLIGIYVNGIVSKKSQIVVH